MKRFAGLALVSAGQILVTFVAQLAVIRTVGAGLDTDALFAAMTVPQLLVSVLVVSISQVLIAQLALRPEDEASRIAVRIAMLVGAAFALVALLLVIPASHWLRVLFPAIHEERGPLLALLLLVSACGMVFQAMEAILWSFHHARGAHLFADGTGLVAALLSLGVLVVAMPPWGVTGAAAAFASRPLIHLALMARGVRFGAAETVDVDWLRTIWKESWPPMAGALFYKFDVLVDRVLTGLAGAGALSVYYLGHQLSAACGQVMSSSLANPALPIIARGVAAGDPGIVRGEIRRRAGWILVAAVLMYGLFFLGGRPMLSLVFGEGSLSESDMDTLFWVFVCLAGLVVGGAIGQVTAGTFYAMERSRTPTIIGVVTYALYVPLKIVAFRTGGLTALALSVTGFYCVNVLIQSWVLSRGIDRIAQRHAASE